MRKLLALLAATLLLLTGPVRPAEAQLGDASTFLTPFPDNDRYRVQVWGDSMSSGLLDGLKELMAEEPRYVIDGDHRWLGGLFKVDADEEAKRIAAKVASEKPHIVVMMLGAQDRVSIRKGRRRAGVGSEEWKVEYVRRLDLVMRAFRKNGIGLFWVGLPVMRRQDVTSDAETINELFRSRALANGVRFIDIYASFADADGAYDSYGPDLAGKNRLLREGDGVHFTWHGSRKLAHFVEREIKRAAQQAWDERTIPLAGAEAEQARIRPPPTVKLAPLPPSLAKQPQIAGKAAGGPGVARRPVPATAEAGGVKAQDGQIVLRGEGAVSGVQPVRIDIPRPAIPAAILSLVTRRASEDKASKVGDAVMTEILGGVTVVSSVTPSSESGADRPRGAVLTSSPLHRVLQLGETMPAKPGRSDDMPWPRPEPMVLAADNTGGARGPAARAAARSRAASDEAWPGGPSLPRRPTWIERGRKPSR